MLLGINSDQEVAVEEPKIKRKAVLFIVKESCDPDELRMNRSATLAGSRITPILHLCSNQTYRCLFRS